jgi:hypothetical protein
VQWRSWSHKYSWRWCVGLRTWDLAEGQKHWYILQKQLGWHPVAVVQYTFTHKQYKEKHNEREYTEPHIHKNKNT